MALALGLEALRLGDTMPRCLMTEHMPAVLLNECYAHSWKRCCSTLACMLTMT